MLTFADILVVLVSTVSECEVAFAFRFDTVDISY